MSSQVFALIYLSDLDHYIKEVLKIKYYVRYMDDFILIHHDKKYLRYCLNIIRNKVEEEYKLVLNEKTEIINIKNGLDFLGFRFYIKNNKIILKVRNQTKRRFRKRIKKSNRVYLKKEINKKDITQIIASYKGHLKYGNTKGLIENTLKEINKKIPDQIKQLEDNLIEADTSK